MHDTAAMLYTAAASAAAARTIVEKPGPSSGGAIRPAPSPKMKPLVVDTLQ
jgi:hypothetical protein